MTAYTFDQLITFTRTSAATYVGSNGLVAVTPASRNLLLYTQEFDNAVWAKDRITVTNNGATAPDGTLTAEIVTPTAVSGTHGFGTSPSVSLTSGVTYTASIYAKAAGYNFLRFLVYNGSANLNNYFNLSNGTTGTIAAGVTAAITSVGNGWYRCACTFTAAVAATNSVFIVQPNVASADNTTTFTGDGTSGIYLWGAQLEAASAASTYTRNNGGVYPPRFDYDPVTLAPKGLLIEEQRTNLLLRSEEFENASWAKSGATVTANAVSGPDGTNAADKLVEDTGNSQHFVAEALSITSGTTYTFSVYVKAAERTVVNLFGSGNLGGTAVRVNLTDGSVQAGSATVTSAGGGFYRISYALTATATGSGSVYIALYNGSGTYLGDGTSGIYVWGAQLEAGAFATSYIPTVASQVTRTADQASIVAPMFAPWYRQSEGTLVVQADSFSTVDVAVRYVAAAADAAATSRNTVFLYNGKWGSSSRVSGVDQCDLQQAGSYTANATAKIAFAYKSNDFAASVNGAAPLTDTSGSLPSVDRLLIGSYGSTNNLNGHIRSIDYYPTRLTNAQIQALTA